MSTRSLKCAHDALLAEKPDGVIHTCSLCADTDHSEEDPVSGATAATYTQDQHSALVNDAVERATAALAAEKSAAEDRAASLESEHAELAEKLTALQARADVLEAEKAAAEAATEAVRAEFADFKTTIVRAAEIEALKAERVNRIKAVNGSLPADFFTDERAGRWAQMAEEAFDALVADLTVVAAASSSGETTSVHEQARLTAAFSGGQDSTASAAGSGSTLRQFLGARRGTAAA
jgi:hypothetical protein